MSDSAWSCYAVVLIDFQKDFWLDQVASTAPELPTHVADLFEYARLNAC